jgi:hypothetical protein
LGTFVPPTATATFAGAEYASPKEARLFTILPVTLHVPDTSSNRSAVSVGASEPFPKPPAASTWLLASVTAPNRARGTLIMFRVVDHVGSSSAG